MDNKILLIIASLLLPPLAVFLKVGAGKDLIINIVLCFFLNQSNNPIIVKFFCYP